MTWTSDGVASEAGMMSASATIAIATPPALVEAVKSMAASMGLSEQERSRAAEALEAYAAKADADPAYAHAAAMIAHQLRALPR
ncbi:hypothetical protein T8T21_17315 (plasmid) [Limimaricola variabilis]|jgi:hypothetical protein|uniref:hypothetical protein n=1 Tax=Limimaricola variabilis TaxID=1492771 RepID=UPI002AC9C71A|nr:hypothetical protein [Limimaricola variabilis]WPY96512.1 hypothetical protein T8T21_17315 [Limimaricola variabilis]